MTITFKQTIANMKADFRRRLLLENAQGLVAGILVFFKRGMVAAFLYRLSRYCALNQHPILALIILKINAAYAELEISPLAQIGPGLVLADQGGIGVNHAATIGSNCTFFGCVTLTLGVMDSVIGQQDKIVIGDHCVIGHRVKIMRPITLANGTQIHANSLVMKNVNEVGSAINGIPAKVISVEPYADIVRWNPLHPGFLN
jgi:serine acetyltransferase